jgi:hypothetical protein
MDPTTIILEIFGVGSLSVAFAKYTLERRKTMQREDHMKNYGLTVNLKANPTNSPISNV